MLFDVIHDGDHGGDDFITTLLFAAYPELFNFHGVTVCAGNTGVEQAGTNALKALEMASGVLDGRKIPVHLGAAKPLRIDYRLGDDAFGSDGLGGVEFPELHKKVKPQSEDAVAWLAETLLASEKPIALCVTGPATNIAQLLETYPQVKSKIDQIVMMGGGTNPAGNIKPYAEFNFYMDPDAANLVLQSGVPVVLHSLDTTQSAIYTKARQARIRALLPQSVSSRLHDVMRITEELEKASFGAEGAFFHDEQVCAYLAMPENYEIERVSARVLCGADEEEQGRLIVTPDEDGTVSIVRQMNDSEVFFAFLYEGILRILAAHK